MSDRDFRILTIDTSARDAQLALMNCTPSLSVERADILDHLNKSEKCDESDELDSNSAGIGTLLAGMFKQCSYSKSHDQQTRLPSSASQSLIPKIGDLLSENGISASDIGLMVVALGPGSFTGLRIGVVAAKTFAYSTGCNVVGINLMQAVAHQADWHFRDQEPNCFAVAVNAGRGDILAACYERDSGSLRESDPAKIYRPQDWIESLPAAAVVTGSGVELLDLGVLERSGCQIADPAIRVASIETLALLGIHSFLNSGPVDHWTLQPIYSRPSAAEEAAAKRETAE